MKIKKRLNFFVVRTKRRKRGCLDMLILIKHPDSQSVAKVLLYSIQNMLERWGLQGAINGKYDEWIYVAIVVLAAFAMMWVLRVSISLVLHKLPHEKNGTFVRKLLDSRFVERALWVLPPVVLLAMLPFAFNSKSPALHHIEKICSIALVCLFVRAINTLATVCWNIFSGKENIRNRPMKGLVQIIHGIFIGIGVIVSISILINRSPMALITGLGAFAAVLMLVFKDSILGFVSGVLLSQNDIVRNGDWINIPGTPVNGVVLDVALNTVKVRNFDNSIVTLPPYDLISKPIQNWRSMYESGGRRIMRSFTIDINTVRFCTPEMLDKLSEIALLRPFIEEKLKKQGIDSEIETNAPYEPIIGSIETNLGLFRAYLTLYLQQNPNIQSSGFRLMVRGLTPNENGIPIEIYCYSRMTDFAHFEPIQSEIFEHIAAMMPTFGLYPFQYVSGRDCIAQSLVVSGYPLEDIAGTPQEMTVNRPQKRQPDSKPNRSGSFQTTT